MDSKPSGMTMLSAVPNKSPPPMPDKKFTRLALTSMKNGEMPATRAPTNINETTSNMPTVGSMSLDASWQYKLTSKKVLCKPNLLHRSRYALLSWQSRSFEKSTWLVPPGSGPWLIGLRPCDTITR